VIARDMGVCQLCGLLVTGSPDIDHIVEKSKGGDESMSNLRTTCHSCHARRTARDSG
jgi:5-methylcytosine-specific restriction protein A